MPPACRTGSTHACRTTPRPCSESGCLRLSSRQHVEALQETGSSRNNRCKLVEAQNNGHCVRTISAAAGISRRLTAEDSKATGHRHSKAVRGMSAQTGRKQPQHHTGSRALNVYASLLSTQLYVLQCLKQQDCRRAASRTTFAHMWEPAQSQAAIGHTLARQQQEVEMCAARATAHRACWLQERPSRWQTKTRRPSS